MHIYLDSGLLPNCLFKTPLSFMNKNTILLIAVAISTSLIGKAQAQVTRSFIEPVESRLVAATQPDVLTVLSVREGDKVSSGDVLAELDNSVLRKNLQIAQLRADSVSEIKSACANIKIAQKRFEKLTPMLEKGHANPAEVEKAKAEFESAEAELELAHEKKTEFELEVERIKAEIERNVIRSPIDGFVTEIHCRPGEYISTNDRKLVTVVRLDRLRVKFFLLDSTARELKAGQSIRVEVGHKREPVDGKIEFVSPVIDADSGTSRVDVVIENKDAAIRSGSVCFWPTKESGDFAQNGISSVVPNAWIVD